MSPSNIRKVKPSKIRSRSRNKKLAAAGILFAVVLVIAAFFVLYHPPGSGSTKVLLKTSMGDITVQLRNDRPLTTWNFKDLVQQGTYNGTIFHRVIANFMIQGGDPTGTGLGDSSIFPILDEIYDNNRNVRGTIAMAKTNQPNSATSQFFINLVDNGNNVVDSNGTKFDSVYTVFGDVTQGMDVVDAISHVMVDANNRPYTNVTLVQAEILP